MSENAIVCVRTGEEYALHFRDRSGGPIEFGTKLIGALHRADTRQALRAVRAAPLSQWVQYPADAFRNVRRDIEWIYVVSEHGPEQGKTLEIHKTSYGCTRRQFAWLVWSGDVALMNDRTAMHHMELAELSGQATLRALDAFERAAPALTPAQGEPARLAWAGPAFERQGEGSI
jgi:hypothetical protein